jgi:hypothetical protein
MDRKLDAEQPQAYKRTKSANERTKLWRAKSAQFEPAELPTNTGWLATRSASSGASIRDSERTQGASRAVGQRDSGSGAMESGASGQR